ncbi:uncharacterized protein LY79DRAFT_84222 [Colletotrichum navitas]|uniref:Secreted protein n=1 Tax=Colletotrichum navitas TaxID=681940 RepID=A0AAD8PKP0_9PEZI|nr:uncharacterized protein LY79DRAFT_84222 [Colletotrichum navitas]KAK1569501.1 hypothetical protein LY79DRAFT_84222 [Colletotrichum navitas]
MLIFSSLSLSATKIWLRLQFFFFLFFPFEPEAQKLFLEWASGGVFPFPFLLVPTSAKKSQRGEKNQSPAYWCERRLRTLCPSSERKIWFPFHTRRFASATPSFSHGGAWGRKPFACQEDTAKACSFLSCCSAHPLGERLTPPLHYHHSHTLCLSPQGIAYNNLGLLSLVSHEDPLLIIDTSKTPKAPLYTCHVL